MKDIEQILEGQSYIGPYRVDEGKVSTKAALQFEHEIARAFRGDTDTDSPKIYEASVRIIEQLRKMPGSPTGNSAEQLGASTAPLSSDWKRWGGTNKTPKTDLTLGSHNVSLKMGNASQLMSGGKGDATATVMAVLEKSPGTEDIQHKAIAIFDKFVKRAVTNVKGSTGELIRTGEDEAVTMLNEMHIEATNLFNSYFATNPAIYNAVIEEAMSGEIKFGGNIGTATHILSASEDGRKVVYHSTNDEKYVSRVAAQANLRIKFKSDSQKVKGQKTGYTVYRSAFGILLNKMVEAQELEYRRDVLNESINENLIKRAWQKVKDWTKKIYDFLKQGVVSIMEFFGLTVDVDFNNSPNFLV